MLQHLLHLLAEIAQNALLFLLHVLLRILGIALQVLGHRIDIAGERGFGFVADRVFGLPILVLLRLQIRLPLLKFLFLGREFGFQLGDGLLAVFGAQQRALHVDHGELLRPAPQRAAVLPAPMQAPAPARIINLLLTFKLLQLKLTSTPS